jgi:hypothetical protein
MDIKDIRNIQEAYLEVYEERDLDHPHWQTNRQYKRSKRRNQEKIEQRKATSRKGSQNLNFFGGSETSRLTGKISKSPRNQKEELDIYDIILSHLLDEGYADNQESAEVMMINMSEEWRDSIVEAKKPLPISKMKKKEDKLLDSPEATEKYSKALKTPMGSPERKAFYKDMQRWNDIHDTRRSISTRGGKRQLPMPEVGRFKPKYDED